jgi:hypothetical protein
MGARVSKSGGRELTIIAAILEQPVIEETLTHLGLQAGALPRAGELPPPLRDIQSSQLQFQAA